MCIGSEGAPLRNATQKADLDSLRRIGFLSPLDLHFALFMERLSGNSCRELSLAAAIVSRVTREGHICFNMAGEQPLDFFEMGQHIVLPEGRRWGKKIRESSVVGHPGEHRPLILDGMGRLYLYRYWEYQEDLAKAIKSRIGHEEDRLEIETLRKDLARMFPDAGKSVVDWQKVATFAAVRKRFCVITGGPGTGKTTTVAKILALLAERNRGRSLRTALVSPTGKGASRLQEAIKKAKKDLSCDETVKTLLPDEASTVHRLLGTVRGSPYFRFNAERRLPVDTLVVDEASMVDLALMSKLAQALPSEARFILLGDKDQLSSVEAGAVLGDICDTAHSHPFSQAFCSEIRKATGYNIEGSTGTPMLGDSIVRLSKSYRFADKSGIAAVSRSVNEGDGDRAMEILKHGDYPDLSWRPLPPMKSLPRTLKDRVVEEFHDLLRAKDPEEAFLHLERFRVLCALREGPFGVNTVNVLMERILREQKLIRGEGKWYEGRPVLIARNDYTLHLYNGDLGIVLPDRGAAGELRVFFKAPDGKLRAYHPVRLPEHETVYALTVHKSQGSEFDRVLFLLPDRDSPVLTRELVYTAVTRGRDRVEVWGEEGVFRRAVSRRTTRLSGLRDALWEECK
jgi:exodeoxyribonuclease V alpha subunit